MKIVAVWVTACSAFAVEPIWAQGLEEVVVTAQKREQSLQDAPISIAVLDVNALQHKGIGDIADIGASIPNAKITRTPSSGTSATIAIRGSTTVNPAITWEPTVGIYVDGVFIGKNVGGIFDIAELERVEILRGPQGTLYGKNTLGGAVNLITAKPTGEFGGKIRVGFGNYALKTGYASIDTPALDLGDAGRLMAKLSASYKTRDGFYANKPDPYGNPLAGPPSSDELNNLNSKVARYDILWAVNDRLELRHTWDYSDIDQKPVKQQLSYLDPSDPVGINALAQNYLTSTNDNRSATSSDQSLFERSRPISRSLFASYDAGDLGLLGDTTFKYIGNERHLDWDDQIDSDGTPLDLFHSGRRIAYTQQSHELQLLGTTERANYVLGLYYFKESADVYNPIDFFTVFGTPTSHNRYGFDNNSVAAFGQLEWRPAAQWLQDRLAQTFGLRWTKEEKDS
jgi:iron complex outermembrane receptor protein